MTCRPSLSIYLLDSEVLHVIGRAVWRVILGRRRQAVGLLCFGASPYPSLATMARPVDTRATSAPEQIIVLDKNCSDEAMLSIDFLSTRKRVVSRAIA